MHFIYKGRMSAAYTLFFICCAFLFLSLEGFLGAQEEGKTAMDVVKNIKWLGHDTFRVESGVTVIYTDPFEIKNPEAADLILITHDHFDHLSVSDIKKLQTDKTTVVVAQDGAKKIKGNVKVVKPGDKISVSGIDIEVVPAYNTNKQFHPKANGWVGYIFTVDGNRIYIAGDTDFIPEMKNFKVDIALLPVSGTYVMTADEAAQAALAIKPKLAIPMHYGSIIGSEADAEEFKKLLGGKVEVLILKRQ